MTTAEFHFAGDLIKSLKISGHSGYADEGEDIICASVSSTVWMTINGLENVIGAKVSYKEKEALVTLNVKNESLKEAFPMLESLRQFLCNLSIEYEDYLTVKEVHENV